MTLTISCYGVNDMIIMTEENMYEIDSVIDFLCHLEDLIDVTKRQQQLVIRAVRLGISAAAIREELGWPNWKSSRSDDEIIARMQAGKSGSGTTRK